MEATAYFREVPSHRSSAARTTPIDRPSLTTYTCPDPINPYIADLDTPSSRAASGTRSRSGVWGGLTSGACTDELIGHRAAGIL
jgi:hypothetical protein